MDRAASPPRPTIDLLRHVANNYPIIDHHAHNLILPSHSDTIPFETITTEAQGRALRDTFKSLSHLRAAKQLRQLYECGEDADWEDILEQRVEWLKSNSERLHQRCFEGVHALLIDDGFAGPEKVFPFKYHDRYTKAPSKRIVRIETVAERLMENLVHDAKEEDLGKAKFLPEIWVNFTDDFEHEIQDAIEDDNVAGFKSVVCYRTGLDIEPEYDEAAKAVGHPFERYVKNCIRKRTYRIEKKHLNDYLVLRTLEILSERLPHSDSLAKPFQLHTGLGDNDINLLESNPAFLQPLIENYPQVPFVLLHSAYPYTREAGYLATVYRHVYLDIGEVFPMVSRDGQRAILRQALELVPGSKLLYSSDGHWFPETYWLANTQFREVWLDLLTEYCHKGDLTPHQAIGMTKDILFNNANILYDLRHDAIFDETLQIVPKQLTYNPRPDGTSPHRSPIGTPGPSNLGLFNQPPTSTQASRSVSPYSQPPAFPPPPKVPQVYDAALFSTFHAQNAGVRFVYVQWMDYIATIRSRIVPIKEFTRMIQEGTRIGISESTVQNEHQAPNVNTTEHISLEPDLRSLRKTHTKDPLPSATVLSYQRAPTGQPLPSDARHTLETLITSLQYNHSTTLLLSFSLDVVFLTANPPYAPIKPTPSHSLPLLSFLPEILLALDESSIELRQCHATSTPSQYTFVFAPQPPLLAIDTLVHARQLITQIAGLHGVRATLYPRPLDGVNTAASLTLEMHPPDHGMQFFGGGVLRHFPAVCAFALPEEVSYTGPPSQTLLLPSPGQQYSFPLSGTANPYLTLSAILAAGLLGLAANDQFFPEQVDSSAPDSQMPASLSQAMQALKTDGALIEALGVDLVQGYVRVKEEEVRVLGGMGEVERRGVLVARD